MGTSGTVATTTIDTASVIEHAFRRVRVSPSAQTPETVQIAKECLYMLLLNLCNRGLNLWCVEKAYMGVQAGVRLYVTAPGTLDVLNALYSQPTLASSSFNATANGGKATLSGLASSVRVGVQFSAAYTGALAVKYSTDGAVFTTDSSVASATYSAGIYYWFELNNTSPARAYSVEGAAAPHPVVSSVIVAATSYDLPMTQWNRDTYASINNKDQPGRPSTSYFYEKRLTPQLTLWPVPSSNTDHLTVYSHRQPQDVGALSQTLEIPQRWLDGFIWLLSARLCFELPVVDPSVIPNVLAMADKQEFEMEQSETDGAPMYLTPSIGSYTK